MADGVTGGPSKFGDIATIYKGLAMRLVTESREHRYLGISLWDPKGPYALTVLPMYLERAFALLQTGEAALHWRYLSVYGNVNADELLAWRNFLVDLRINGNAEVRERLRFLVPQGDASASDEMNMLAVVSVIAIVRRMLTDR